jgi:CubicO group peptidase (beta-lactamase class C family)
MKKTLLLFCLAALIAFTALAQQKQIKRSDDKTITAKVIDSIAKTLLDAAQITGLEISVINDNKISYVNSYGFKNRAKNEVSDTSECFYAASLAKPLFGYIVMQLVDEGKIDLDKPLYTYLPKPLPDYEKYKDLAGDDRWKLITPRMCLDHTTGFPNWRESNPHNNNKLEIFFKPGSRYSYSGEGINLLQLVVETVTSRHLEDLAQEKVFRPFGMRNTSFLWQTAFDKNYAVGHDTNGDTIPRQRFYAEYAAGSMETTVSDYSRFIAAAMQGKRLSAKAKQEMFSPQIGIYSKRQFDELSTDSTGDNNAIHLSYGLGLGLFTSPYGKAFFKEGHGVGWVNYVIAFPEKKMALVIFCNDANGESIFKDLVEKIMGVTIPWYWEGYTPYRASVKLPENVLQQFTGEYDGKIHAIVTLINGQLKVESATVYLPKTNLFATNDHQFFLKIMDTTIDFVKGPDGKIIKAVLDDEGDHYELTKVK